MKGSPDQHDFGDAHLLSDLTRVGYLPKVWLAPPWVRELSRLVRYRQQQVDQRRNAKLRIGALLRDHRLRVPAERQINVWTQAWLAWLTHEACKQLPKSRRGSSNVNGCASNNCKKKPPSRKNAWGPWPLKIN